MMLFPLFRASIEGAVLVAGIWLAGRLWSRLSAATLTLLWWCAAAKFLLALVWITPIELRLLPARPIAPAAIEAPAPAADAHSLTRTSILVDDGGRGDASRPDWTAVAQVVWLGGVGLMLVVAVRRWRAIVALVRRSTGAPAETVQLAAGIARSLGLRTTPRIRMSAEVRTPLVAGLARPVVVLPAGRFLRLSTDEQRMTLCHELAHVQRADLWFGCVPALAERVFFFHPLVRLAAREYALCREAACDRTVIATLDASPQDYGRLLLTLGVAPGRTAAAAAGASWSFFTLKRRISMLRESSVPSRRTRWIAAPVVAAAVVAMVPMRLTARPGDAAPGAAPLAIESGVTLSAPVSDQRDQKEDHLNYVLFIDEHHTNSSGTSEDIRIARRYQRNGERLLWFRDNAREYVIRDASTIDRVLELWRPVNQLGDEMGRVGGRQGELGAQQGIIGERQGRIGAEQGRLGARQGELGARQGQLAEREVRARSDADRRAIAAEYRQIDEEMRALDRQMRETSDRMRELEKPMGDLDVRMQVLGREMDALGKKMDAAVKKAEGEMRTLVDRAIATGAATPVK
jgi:bla regulator protein blaR1